MDNDIVNQATQAELIDELVEKTKQWQRISPIAIIYFAFSIVQVIVGQFIYIIPAFVVGYKHITENPLLWGPIALGIVVLLFASAILSFYFFQYRLTEGSIEIRSGVLKKKHINLPFSRIQNVKLEQPFYYRLTGYACLQLDTAGSAKQEAKVVALPLAFANALKQEILASHQEQTNNQQDELTGSANVVNDNKAAIVGKEQLLNTRSLSDLVIHGVTSNRIWIFLGALAPFFDNIARFAGDFLLDIGIDVKQLFDLNTHSWFEVGLYALSLTMLVMLVLTMFSVIGSILTFYGYTLSKTGDKYIRRSGLLTKHEVTMRLSRLQMIVQKQDWLDLVLKRINLKFEQTNAHFQNLQASAINNKIIVPSIKPDESQTLIDDVYPENRLGSVYFNAISKRFLIRYLGYMLLPILTLLEIILFQAGQHQVAALVLIPFGFIAFLIVMRWFRWGYASDDNFIYVRKGYIGVDYYICPIYKIQQTKFIQSKLMARHQLASVKMVLASGGVDIPYMTEQQAFELINQSLWQVESTRKPWM